MYSPFATVTAVRNGRATLIFDSQPICPRCAAGKGCGAGLINGMTREREWEVEIPRELELSGGDQVQLALSDAGILRAAALAYGMPLSGILLSLALAWLTFGPLSDPAAVSIATVGLAAGWLLGRSSLKSASCRNQFQPRIAQDYASGRGTSS